MQSVKKGFTLLESLIVLAIIAIFAVVSLPLLHHLYDYANSQLLQSQLLRTLQFARQEAQVRQMPVAFCNSDNSTACSGNWKDSKKDTQLIFVDQNQDGILNNNEQVLSLVQTRANRGLLHWRSFSAERNDLLFLPTGSTRSDNGTFWYCPESTSSLPSWAIMLSKSGRARVVYPNQNGIILDTHGRTLQCDRQDINEIT